MGIQLLLVISQLIILLKSAFRIKCFKISYHLNMIKKITYIFLLLLFIVSCNKEDDSNNSEPELGLPVIETFNATDLSLYSVTLAGRIIDHGNSNISEVGIVVSESSLPTVENNLNKFIIEPDSSGGFSIVITSIPSSTTFYVRAYGINDDGTGYGNEIEFTSLADNIYEGDIILSNQQQVNDFGSNNYTTINGSLEITGSVTSLEPLNSIIIVNQGFKIINTASLQNLEGLENLKITGNIFPHGFAIENNSALQSLTGLNGLEATRGEFTIIDNNLLTNLEGLNNLRASGAGTYFFIKGCNNLRSLTGLENLSFIGGTLTLDSNNLLNDLTALRNLTFIGEALRITNNASLSSLNGFDNLTTVEETIYIENNSNLRSLSGFLSLNHSYGISIKSNNALTSLSGFENFTSLGGIYVQYNDAIESLQGLNNVVSLDEFSVKYNQNLSSLAGLDNVTSTEAFNISYNPSLQTLSGLENLNSITGGTTTTISYNFGLTSLAGLDNLVETTTNFRIYSNTILTDFCPLKNLFENGLHNGTWEVTYNAINPSIQDIITECQ